MSRGVGRGRPGERQMAIAAPPDRERYPADAETLVPCPCCRIGMVPPEVAARVRELLSQASDGPGPPSAPGG